MTITKTKVAATFLGIAFLGAAIPWNANEPQTAEINSIVCGDNILIPNTTEQAERLEEHAAALYDLFDPVQREQLESAIKDFTEGATYEITGETKTESTLPDGSTHEVPCLTYRVLK